MRDSRVQAVSGPVIAIVEFALEFGDLGMVISIVLIPLAACTCLCGSTARAPEPDEDFSICVDLASDDACPSPSAVDGGHGPSNHADPKPAGGSQRDSADKLPDEPASAAHIAFEGDDAYAFPTFMVCARVCDT